MFFFFSLTPSPCSANAHDSPDNLLCFLWNDIFIVIYKNGIQRIFKLISWIVFNNIISAQNMRFRFLHNLKTFRQLDFIGFSLLSLSPTSLWCITTSGRIKRYFCVYPPVVVTIQVWVCFFFLLHSHFQMSVNIMKMRNPPSGIKFGWKTRLILCRKKH